MPIARELPLRIRMLNGVGRWLARGGIRIAPFDPDALRKLAMRKTGLSDFDEDPRFREALAVLCRSAEDDAALSLAGRVAIRDYVVHALVNRLRYVHARNVEPEVAEVELEPPIIVIGLPRSGTTLLHHLLALDPQARSLLFWELREPIPGPGPDRRRDDLARMLRDIKRMDGGIDGKHHFGVDNPEECMLLLDSTLMSVSFWVFAPVHGYLAWLRHQDQREGYQVYRWYLQRFQRDSPGRRLVLKAPAHTAALGALLEAVPNARLVQTHRDPAQVAPSLHSLIFSLHSMVGDPVAVERMCQGNLAHLEHIVATAEATRAAGHTWVDVRYEQLVRDPVAVVRDIHRSFDLPVTDEFVTRMERFVAARPKDKFGTHQYTAEDFGTTAAALRERFSEYHRKHVVETST
ncbi:sulfotransferase family protein [Paraliomyxa miuraensis]|uniref:sulfotransferase family protein n=1 Tax=Paraliomyxa miuraensis TaxID=376150 RepID=UPI00224DEF97|nr:sulfotransferase [Paraliomyxa miuraensis]MCX4241188.1 sulfotransferase [Paraliomyxa miuraensis]